MVKVMHESPPCEMFAKRNGKKVKEATERVKRRIKNTEPFREVWPDEFVVIDALLKKRFRPGVALNYLAESMAGGMGIYIGFKLIAWALGGTLILEVAVP